MQKVLENRCQSCKKSDNIWGKYTSRAISPICWLETVPLRQWYTVPGTVLAIEQYITAPVKVGVIVDSGGYSLRGGLSLPLSNQGTALDILHTPIQQRALVLKILHRAQTSQKSEHRRANCPLLHREILTPGRLRVQNGQSFAKR